MPALPSRISWEKTLKPSDDACGSCKDLGEPHDRIKIDKEDSICVIVQHSQLSIRFRNSPCKPRPQGNCVRRYRESGNRDALRRVRGFDINHIEINKE